VGSSTWGNHVLFHQGLRAPENYCPSIETSRYHRGGNLGVKLGSDSKLGNGSRADKITRAIAVIFSGALSPWNFPQRPFIVKGWWWASEASERRSIGSASLLRQNRFLERELLPLWSCHLLPIGGARVGRNEAMWVTLSWMNFGWIHFSFDLTCLPPFYSFICFCFSVKTEICQLSTPAAAATTTVAAKTAVAIFTMAAVTIRWPLQFMPLPGLLFCFIWSR